MFTVVVIMGFLSQEAGLFPFCLGLAVLLCVFFPSVCLSFPFFTVGKLGRARDYKWKCLQDSEREHKGLRTLDST